MSNIMTPERIKSILDQHSLWLKGRGGKRADLRWANLRWANLEGANLEGADLRWADLGWANLEGANLEGAKLAHFQICPQEGSFIAYKKTTRGVIKLLIPEGAKRTNSLVGRKCRANVAEVIGGEGVGGTGTHYKGITYDLGLIECPDYDDDIRVECAKGIHFFMTLDEAKEWS